MAAGYGFKAFRADALAGLVVAMVAMPLNISLAIASGVRPENGLYTAIIAGIVVALLGGSKFQITGPTAAFVVILAPLTAKFGIAGLAIASVMAGLLLVLMGILRLGRLVEYVPYPVTLGFTTGIAVVIATLQVKDMLGLTIARMPDGYIERVGTLWSAAVEKFGHQVSLTTFSDLIVGAITLALLILWTKVPIARLRRVPAVLVVLPLMAAGTYYAGQHIAGFAPQTIATRFTSISASLPPLTWPWSLPGPVDASGVSQPLVWETSTAKALLSAAFAMAMLGAIVSLLSAVVADGLSGKKHNPDSELVAQGIGSIITPLFGGFAATGAIARTTANIRAGAQTPLAAVMHAVFLLLAMVLMAPTLKYLPMASMAAMLLVVARNMADVKHLAFLVRFAPRGDVAVMGVCFTLTVVFDMVVAVSFGFVLASILFMRRMAEVSHVRLVDDDHPAFAAPMPKGVRLLEVSGPLFFGAAAKALGTLETLDEETRVVIMDLGSVPTIDTTGLVNLDAALTRLGKRKVYVILAGVHDQPMELLERAGWDLRTDHVIMAGHVESAVEIARAWLGS